MRLQKVQDALNKKNIKFEYTEEDGCGSLDFICLLYTSNTDGAISDRNV